VDGGPIDPSHSNDVYERSLVYEHRKREELWVRRMQAQNFKNGLVIVGLAYTLSIAFRLSRYTRA